MSAILDSERRLHSLPELKDFWQDLLPHLKERCILLLNGDIGAGKTTSVQVIAELLGMKDVQSPSFAIHLRYENSKGMSLDHLDLYRLKDDDDLESSGFWDLFAQEKALIIIEWAQRLDYQYLPMNWQRLEVTLKKLSDSERSVSVRALPSGLSVF